MFGCPILLKASLYLKLLLSIQAKQDGIAAPTQLLE